MADNTVLNLGTGGDTIATDDIGGVKHQLVKLEFGLIDNATLVSTTNPLPVILTGTNNVTNAGTFAVQAALTAGTNTNEVVGDAAHDAVAAGNPVLTGAYASAAAPTDVSADADAVRLWALRSGAMAIQETYAGILSVAGNGASGTGVQRVTIANDSTGILAAVTNVATIGTSVTPGTAATHLGKAEDAAHTSGDVGVMMLGVARAANTALVSADGDYGPIQLSALGAVKVAITEGAGSGGTALADAAAFTRATTSITPIGGVVETSAPTVTNGNVSVISLTTGGAVRVAVASGGIAGVIEDVASAGAEEGILGMTIRQDTIASTTSADGDFQNQKTNSVGALYTAPTYIGATAITTGNGTTSAGSQRVTIASDNTAFSVNAASAGSVAIDAALSGNPIITGGRASTATPTAMSADNDVQAVWLTRTGATVIDGALVDDSAFTPGTTRVIAIGHQADETATDSVDEGDIGTPRMTLDRKVIVTPYAHAGGGYTPVSTVSAASTNATSLKGSAGTVGAVTVTNVNAAMRYLKFYNKATAPTVGTDTPVYVIPLPGNTAGAGATVDFPCGLSFTTGIAWALTTGATVADTGAVAASEIIVSIAYI